jgi:type IV secretion system protein VirD4
VRPSNVLAYLWYGGVVVLAAASLPGAVWMVGVKLWVPAHLLALWRYFAAVGTLPTDLLMVSGGWLFGTVLLVAVGPPIEKEGAYGSARWASLRDLKRFKPGLLDKAGFVLGRYGGLGRFGGRLLMSKAPLSALVVAPAGTGKTDGVIVPSILSCDPFSLVINDPKGELYERTAGHRARLGPVLRIEWTAGAQGSTCWNPIDLASLPADAAGRGDEVDRFSAILIVGDERDFWVSSGRAALSALTMYRLYEGERLGFAPTYAGVIEWMAGIGQADDPAEEDPGSVNLRKAAAAADAAGYPTRVAVGLRQLAIMDARTRSNVLATVMAALKIFSNENVASVTSRTDLRLTDLRGIRGKPISIYIVVPVFDQDAFGRITAMLIESATRHLTARKLKRGERGVRFILDEVGFFPPIQAISMGPAITRGYDAAFLFACQDYGQIKSKWGQGGLDNIITNTAFKVVLTQNHPDTAALVSRAIGQTTRKRKSRSTQSGGGRGLFGKGSVSESEEGAPLIRSEDIMCMPFGRQFVLAQNAANRPVPARSGYYKAVPRLRRRASLKAPPPPAGSRRAA